MTTETSRRSHSERIFAVLESVAAAGTPATLSEIARHSALPVSTTHRLLRELLEWGALVRTTDGRYQLGERIWRLGMATPWERTIRAAAAAHLRTLAQETGSAVALAALSGERLICLETIPGRWPSITLAKAGDELPVAATSAGKVLLADGETDRITSVLRRGLPRLTPFTPTTPRMLLSQIDQARQSGYATAHAEYALGQSSVSVKVDTGAPDLSVALTLLVPASSREFSRLVPPLRRAAWAITAAVRASAPR